MVNEAILDPDSRLIALYGESAQYSERLKIFNRVFAVLGLKAFVIGLNATPENFSYMFENMPASKLKMALMEPEFYKKAAELSHETSETTARLILADAVRVANGRLQADFLLLQALHSVFSCRKEPLTGKHLLILQTGEAASLLLEEFCAQRFSKVTVAASSVEDAGMFLRQNESILKGIETDVAWLAPGEVTDLSPYDVVFNGASLLPRAVGPMHFANAGGRLLIDATPGSRLFDDPVFREEGEVVDAKMLNAALACEVAKRWLGTACTCETLKQVMKGADHE